MSLLDRLKALVAPTPTEAPKVVLGRVEAAALEFTTAVPRIALTDSEGLQLVNEIGVEGRRFPVELQAATEQFSALVLNERPTDPEALAAWGQQYVDARRAFWEALEGEVVQGVEVVRRRA